MNSGWGKKLQNTEHPAILITTESTSCFLSFNKFLRSKIFTDKSVQLVAVVGAEDCCEEAVEGCEEI